MSTAVRVATILKIGINFQKNHQENHQENITRNNFHGMGMVLDLGLMNKPKLPFAVTAIYNLCAYADIKVPSESDCGCGLYVSVLFLHIYVTTLMEYSWK